MKEYVTIGTKNIAEDIFRKILRPLDINFYKPNGGLWSSEFISRIYCISEWHDYLLYEDQETASYKNINAGAIFTLKNNAKILNIDSEEKIIELSQKYPSWHYILTHYDNPELNIIDFETLSKDYDGVEVSINKLGYNKPGLTFNSWSVNTLLLFNLNCIEKYQSVDIEVSLFNYDKRPYISKISNPKQVLNHSEYYEEVYNYITIIFNKILKATNYQKTNYQEYFNYLINCTEKCIDLALNMQKPNINIINTRLKDNDIQISNETLIRNIAYNYLSEYLAKNKEEEKKFIKTLKK
ncbi:MAG: hypothetical protein U0K48_05165 [Bacilli bacterium]|mgnify:FL=1|nr:hypothetical protein [Bacilli bacterium]